METLRLQNIKIEAALLEEVIATERAAGVERFNSTLAVTDPFSTPFFRAVKREGYKPVVRAGGSVESKTCDRCRGHSAILHLLGDAQQWLCPACDRN